MTRRLLLVLPLTAALAGGLLAGAPAPAQAAGTLAIGAIPGATTAHGLTAPVVPRVAVSGQVQVTSKALVVRRGTTTVAQGVPAARLPAGTYSVTTVVRFRNYTGSGTTVRYGAVQTRTRAQQLVITWRAPVDYANCTDLRRTYPHGVGLSGAVDRTSGTPRVTTYLRNAKLYSLNTESDADRDSIACEQL